MEAVFPAPAGMNRKREIQDAFQLGVPRACGDEPSTLSHQHSTPKCSPRLRG